MRVSLVILSLLLTAAAAFGGSVKVYIAPQTTFILASGKISFDIYWINENERPAAIPALERYSFTFPPWPGSRLSGWRRAPSITPGLDRSIAGWAIVHDTTTISVDAKPNELVAISAEFRGDKSRFKSNTIVLRKSPKA
jgi:hypothetical protein